MLRFSVPNMTCGGCARAVTKALQTIDAAACIETDPAQREIRIETNVDESVLRAALEKAGYPATRLETAA